MGDELSKGTLNKTILGLCAVAALASVLAGCATVEMPADPVERALYVDLRKIVETRERTEWLLDQKELEEAAPAAMRSTCVVEPETAQALVAWLDLQIEQGGGPAREAFMTNGHDLGAVEDVLTIERVRALLDHTAQRREECPFWMLPDPEFAGIQTDTDRFVMMLQSNGGGSLLLIDGQDAVVSGEGGGQLIFAWGVSEGLTLGLGAEVGGRGTVGSGDNDEQKLSANINGAAPFVMRFQHVTRVIDVELAATASSPLDNFDPRPGVRLLFGFGLSASRVGDFMPVAMGMFNYELQPAFDGLPTTHIFRIGTRIGISYDP